MKKLMLILKTKKSLPDDPFSQILALEDGRILSKGWRLGSSLWILKRWEKKTKALTPKEVYIGF